MLPQHHAPPWQVTCLTPWTGRVQRTHQPVDDLARHDGRDVIMKSWSQLWSQLNFVQVNPPRFAVVATPTNTGILDVDGPPNTS
jgi:hypothetical protein